jgi:hypothetical protein
MNHAYKWQKKQMQIEKKKEIEHQVIDRPTRRERERICFTFERHIPKENKLWWKSLTLDQKWEVVNEWSVFETHTYTMWSNYYIAPKTDVSCKEKFLEWLGNKMESIKPPINNLRDNILTELLD